MGLRGYPGQVHPLPPPPPPPPSPSSSLLILHCRTFSWRNVLVDPSVPSDPFRPSNPSVPPTALCYACLVAWLVGSSSFSPALPLHYPPPLLLPSSPIPWCWLTQGPREEKKARETASPPPSTQAP